MVDGGMRAFSDAVGIAVREELRLKERLDDGAERVVNDPVAEGRCADPAVFGVVDREMDIGAGLVGEMGELVLQLQQVVRELMVKPRRRGLAALVTGRLAVGQEQVRPTDYL